MQITKTYKGERTLFYMQILELDCLKNRVVTSITQRDEEQQRLRVVKQISGTQGAIKVRIYPKMTRKQHPFGLSIVDNVIVKEIFNEIIINQVSTLYQVLNKTFIVRFIFKFPTKY